MSNPKRRILFIDRDGTLITEPPDQQTDSLEKLDLVPGVIPALLKLRQAGYEFVIVTNQDGLGTESFPTRDYEIPQQKMIDIFSSQGIDFSEVLVDPHFEHENAPTRKPGIGLVLGYLKSGELDLADSWVIGDRETDLMLADNMGIGGLRIGEGFEDWASITHQLVNRPRQSTVERKTNETDIRVSVDLDAGNEARRRIEQITADVEVGTIYDGKVAKLMDFGAFVTILPGKDGLVHISQICEERVQNVSDKLSEGDIVKVKVLEVDKQGRIRLSMKAVSAEEASA